MEPLFIHLHIYSRVQLTDNRTSRKLNRRVNTLNYNKLQYTHYNPFKWNQYVKQALV